MSLPTALFRLPSRFRHGMLPRIFTCQHSQNAIDSENPAPLRNVPFIADRTVPINADIYTQ